MHTHQGSWNAREQRLSSLASDLPVYHRQIGAPVLVGEDASLGETVVFENDAVKCWTLPAPHPQDILIASFKTKMHTLSPDVVRGIVHAVDLAEASYQGLVIGHVDDPFSAGADLKAILPAFQAHGVDAVEPIEREMQDMALRLRYAQVPVVAALAGMALGGGCELAVHCARRVAHFETYIGLVEVGIGLVPGAGGLTFGARRAAELRDETAPDAPLLAFLKRFALAAAGAQVSASALDARRIGYPARRRSRRHASQRSAVRGRAPGAGHGAGGLARALAGALPGGGPRCHRHPEGATAQHARGRVHQRLRLRGRRTHRARHLRGATSIPDRWWTRHGC